MAVLDGLCHDTIDTAVVEDCLIEMTHLLATHGKRTQAGRGEMVEFGHMSKITHCDKREQHNLEAEFPYTMALVSASMRVLPAVCKGVSLDTINLIVRRYQSGETLPFHVDYHEGARNKKYHFYEEPIYGCILKNTSDSSLTFKRKSKCVSLPEHTGMVLLQMAPIRFETEHGVPPLSKGERISLTWRFVNNA